MTANALDSGRDLAESDLVALHRRTGELLKTTIPYVPNPEFRADDEREEDEIVQEVLAADLQPSAIPADLPAHLRRLCESRLLNYPQEMALFRQMNFLKFRANQIRQTLDAHRLDPAAIAKIEQLLAKAQIIRDQIIKSNLRLVISIVKKFVTPQLSFDDMLSDGTCTLMQAVDKFDFNRGFRFSTYAYRAIARSAYRTVAAARKDEVRFTDETEERVAPLAAGRTVATTKDRAWSQLRELTTAMLDRLDRREQLIIRSRFALGAHRKVRTCQSVANKLGVSKERVRQLELRAITKLRTLAAEFGLDELLGGATG